MQKTGTALVLIILGLIVLAFPLLGLIPLSLITGFLVLILGIGLLIGGIIQMGESAGSGTELLNNVIGAKFARNGRTAPVFQNDESNWYLPVKFD